MTLASGREFLSIPGPTTVPDEVLRAMHRPAVDIYSGGLLEVTTSCLEDLRRIFRTEQGRVYIYAANGHGAWEAALANVLSRGELVLVLDSGRFARGWGEMAAAMGVEVEVLVHGKIPLGVTDRCFLLTESEETDPKCPSACRAVHWLTSRQWALKTVGKGVLSGRDMCLLEHLPRLVADGFRVFRVEGLYETAAYRSEIGAVYREALARAFDGGGYALDDRWADAVRRHAPRGLCNGYLFGTSGQTYVGTVLQDGNPEV